MLMNNSVSLAASLSKVALTNKVIEGCEVQKLTIQAERIGEIPEGTMEMLAKLHRQTVRVTITPLMSNEVQLSFDDVVVGADPEVNWNN
jgi:hypothetical protein